MLRWILRLVLVRFLAHRFWLLGLLMLAFARWLPWERERREAPSSRSRSRGAPSV
jgi:hypothetical protein